jgi:FKBP-type peptidyl-prolyl cis-trans isomerase
MTIRVVILAFITLFLSCNRDQKSSERRAKLSKTEMADLNRYLVSKERERIESFIDRKNLTMIESPTGLWYMIRNEGEGDYFKDFDRILFGYECSLLDGTLCYSSADMGPKEIILGRGELEAGLNQGLKMLKPGGEATFILPPHMAYGFTGDGKKIPARAVIIYNIHILRDQ